MRAYTTTHYADYLQQFNKPPIIQINSYNSLYTVTYQIRIVGTSILGQQGQECFLNMVFVEVALHNEADK